MTQSSSVWNQKKIQELMETIDGILDEEKDGLSLYELIKALSSCEVAFFDARPLAEPQGLFETNFVVMNALYQLGQENVDYHYEIHSLKVCKHPNAHNKSKTQQLSEPDPLEAYYLDWGNFEQTEEDINQLIHDFWERMLVIEFEDQDLHTLSLTKPTTLAEIKQRYRKLSQQHHPDKGGDAELFLEIQQAYKRLTQG